MTPPRRFPFPIPDGWFQVGASHELLEGQVRALHYFARELVMFRDADGQARVFDAWCPHLGAHLGKGGAVVEGRLRCPFHHWEFDGEGRCAAVPYAKRIPPKASLRAWPVVEKNGFVHVWHHKQGAAPSFDVPDVPEYGHPDWTGYHHREFVVNSCNQELAENSVDPAHFKYVHRTAEVPEARAWTEGHLFRAEMDYPMLAGETLLKGQIDIFAHGPGLGVTYFRGIVDTTVVISGTPIDAEHVHQRLSFMVKKRETPQATEGLARVFVAEIARQFEEDMPIWEHKRYWDRPVLCDGDGPIAEIRRWAQQFY
jgi:phenylpropionate dioxygenase-like ring-hydroxylating dioxygenase large terminal subunit